MSLGLKIDLYEHAWISLASHHSRLMGNLMSSTGGGSEDPGSVNNLVPISESDNPVTPFSVSENGRRPENHSALSRHNEFLMRLHRNHLAATSSHHSGKVSYFLQALS